MRRIEHGGAIARAEARFGRPAAGWLDLSTGINPWPYPLGDLPESVWTRLPDEDAADDLRDAAAQYYGVRGRSWVVAAPGSQALIQVLPRLVPRGRVAILGLTYGEHALCWRRGGHAVTVTDALSTDADVIVVTNPNNPDGRAVEPHRLLATAARLAARGGLLIVDEAFADVRPEISVASEAGREGLCVVRSFGKFFGLGGVRLGFALGPAALVGRLADDLGPWAVAGPTIEIGRRALRDAAWVVATRAKLTIAAARLDERLTANGLEVIGGTDLYRLARASSAGALWEHLARRGVLARAFAERPDWLRFGLPVDENADGRLAEALSTAR